MYPKIYGEDLKRQINLRLTRALDDLRGYRETMESGDGNDNHPYLIEMSKLAAKIYIKQIQILHNGGLHDVRCLVNRDDSIVSDWIVPDGQFGPYWLVGRDFEANYGQFLSAAKAKKNSDLREADVKMVAWCWKKKKVIRPDRPEDMDFIIVPHTVNMWTGEVQGR